MPVTDRHVWGHAYGHDKVITLEEVGFLFSKKSKCHLKSLFGEDASILSIDWQVQICDQRPKTGRVLVVLQLLRSQFNIE
jgi:hypothetical protein